MKIEVTFNKSARKQFRQQCVKKLQTFVAQIRNNGPHHHPTDEFLKDQGSDSAETTINIRQYNPSKTAKQVKVKEPKYSDQKQNTQYSILATIGKNQAQDQSRQLRKAYKQDGYARNQILNSERGFNILEMKESVNTILENIERNARAQLKKQNNLQEKIETVNRKLDRVLTYFQQTIIQNEAKSEYESEQQLMESQKEEFYSKFDRLADKYQQIKLKSPHPQKGSSRQNKEPFSLSSTRESVTFRHL